MINIIQSKLHELSGEHIDPTQWVQDKENELVEIVGSRKMLTLIYTNKSQPTVSQLFLIARKLKVPMEQLLRFKQLEKSPVVA